ncbi:MAG: twin-arginine translocase subunit TatC [Clostridia bacterium]|nr:twin-arginine translocase subunit TatC [Clostridia bacterium]
MAEEQNKQALGEHLAALRKVLLWSIGVIGIAFVAVFYLAIDYLMAFITNPIVARNIQVIYTEMSAALMTKLKVAFIAGVVVASPFVFWQIWSFIKPALYKHEQKAFRLTFGAAVILFLMGVAFCYVAVYFLAVDFFLIAGENLATPMLAIDKYVNFLFGFILPFGLAFELPVALYITTKIGLTNYKMLASKRKYLILAVVVIAAFLTPPDVVSQIMLSIPILLLFEISLLICRMVKPREKEAEE